MHRSLKAEAYLHLGEAYTALAAAKEIPPAETTNNWRNARDMFQRSLDIWHDMGRRGILGVQDERQLDEVTGQIAECDVFLQK